MNTLRYSEHISLTDAYYRIITSDEFKGHKSSVTSSLREPGGKSGSSKSNESMTRQNLDLLRSVLLSVSSVFIIQEDSKIIETLQSSCFASTIL